MTATANGPLSSRAAAGPGPAGTGDGIIAQLSTLLRALGRSDFRRRLCLLATGMVVVVCCNAGGQVTLNRWQRAFYDAIERRDVPDFVVQLAVFAAIASALLVLVVGQTWLQEMIKVRAARVADLRPARPVAGTQARLPAGLRRRDRRQPRPAHPPGRATPHRAHDDPGRRPAAVLAPARQLRRRALGALGAGRVRLTPATSSSSPATWCGARSPTRSAARCSPGASAGRWSRSTPSATRARPSCASRWWASASTPTASRCTAARRTSAARSASRSSAWWLSWPASPAASPASPGSPPATAGSRWWCRSWSRRPATSAAACRFGGLMMVVGAFNQVQASLRWFVDNLAADRRLARHAAARRGLSRRLGGGRVDRRGRRAASTSSPRRPRRLVLEDVAGRAARRVR